MQPMTKRSRFLAIVVLFLAWVVAPGLSTAEDDPIEPQSGVTELQLKSAVMCEEIVANLPRHETIIFSISKKNAVCYTSFENVPDKTFIFHNWYHQDIPAAKIKLALFPPRWSTFSSIKIRRSDIGPWRVEITDADDVLLRTLRFSITE
jgi:hypothetical protein